MTIRKNGRILAGGGGAVSADTNLSNLTAIGETHIGIKGYDATRTFKTNDVVSLVDGNGDTKLYKSLVDNNIGNPVSDTTKWAEVLLGSKIDNETIQSNDDKEIEVHGVLDAMDSKAMKFVECTVEQYEQWKADGELLPNTFYWKNDEVSTNVKSFRNVGDIFYTSRLDTYLNGAVECNGGEYYVADYIGEQNVGRLLQQGKLPYVSYADYATAISSKGSCRAFAYDSGTTFKVPTLNNVYIEAGTASSAGEFIDESLPNITGEIHPDDTFRLFVTGAVSGTGCLETTNKSMNFIGGTSSIASGTDKVSFDASLSSSTYQDNAKVHPDSVKYRAMIQLATQTTDEAIATMTQMRAELDSLKALPHIINSQETATGGYNVYSNGYYEEWGNVNQIVNPQTITLSKTMKNTNYVVLFTACDVDDNAHVISIAYRNKTTTTISFVSGYSGTFYPGIQNWKVSGFLAEGQY